MTLLRRVVVEKRPLLIPLAAAIILNAAVYALVVYPLSVKQAGANDRANAAAASLQAAEREMAAARALVSGKGRAEVELATFYEKVLPSNLTAARRMTYATLPALAQETDVKLSNRQTGMDATAKVDSAAKKDTRFGHLQIKMILQGEYASLRKFIYELESAPEFVIIDDVALAQTDAERPLTLTLALSAYYRLGPNGS
jgi:Type II secretion system (T2SS), protein M subtype b